MATESTPSSPSSSTEFRVVVPARYGSTRLPGKPLLMLAGRPMIEWVYRRACRSSARQVIIATDDARILEAAHRFGARALMTAATHPSGTDRLARRAAGPQCGQGRERPAPAGAVLQPGADSV